MSLESILEKYGVELKDTDGKIRNAVDVLEDMYLKLAPHEFIKLGYEISEEEKFSNLFDVARGRKYRGVKDED